MRFYGLVNTLFMSSRSVNLLTLFMVRSPKRLISTQCTRFRQYTYTNMVNSRSDHGDFESLFTKIQIHSINNLHVYFIKFRTNDINRIGVNTTCKKKTKTPLIVSLTASLHYPYLPLHTSAEIQILLGKH